MLLTRIALIADAENIDCEAIAVMEDDDLKMLGIDKLGDRIKLRARAVTWHTHHFAQEVAQHQCGSFHGHAPVLYAGADESYLHDASSLAALSSIQHCADTDDRTSPGDCDLGLPERKSTFSKVAARAFSPQAPGQCSMPCGKHGSMHSSSVCENKGGAQGECSSSLANDTISSSALSAADTCECECEGESYTETVEHFEEPVHECFVPSHGGETCFSKGCMYQGGEPPSTMHPCATPAASAWGAKAPRVHLGQQNSVYGLTGEGNMVDGFLRTRHVVGGSQGHMPKAGSSGKVHLQLTRRQPVLCHKNAVLSDVCGPGCVCHHGTYI
jgi:hypothetical protein